MEGTRSEPVGFEKDVVFAFDLEGSGPCVASNPVVEIGAVVKSMRTGATIERFECTGRCREGQYEQRCAVEFWDKQDPDRKRRRAYAAAPPQYEMWKSFVDVLKRTFERHANTKVVTDNPSYDGMMATVSMQRYLDPKCWPVAVGVELGWGAAFGTVGLWHLCLQPKEDGAE